MDSSQYADENTPRNTPRHNVVQNEKRKPLESPFSAFSPANRHAKKKGRILCEPGDSNLEASMMDESVLHTEDSDSFTMPRALKQKVLFADGDAESVADVLSGKFDESIIDPTQTEGDRTFSAETRPYNPASFDPNMDETFADMSMNQTFSTAVAPVVPSSSDPNLDETLAEMTMNETFSNVVRPLVPSAVDPNMDETLAETTFNQTLQSMGNDTLLVGDEDDLAEDADRTLGEAENEVKEGMKNGGTAPSTPSAPSLFEELNGLGGDTTVGGEQAESTLYASMEKGGEGEPLSEEINTFELTVPVDVTVREDEEESAVEASQENSLMKEGGAMSLFDELNSQSGSELMEDVKEQRMADLSMMHDGEENDDDVDGMADDSPMDESILSTMTAMGITEGVERRQFYKSMKQRLSQFNVSIAPKTPQLKETQQRDESTPTRSDLFVTALASPASVTHDTSLSETIQNSPGTPRGNRYNMNESHLSFIMLEAECTNTVYLELKRDMRVLQDELTKSRELAEKVERERDNARKEVEDYMFMMETTKKRMMSEKTNLTKQLFELENELTEARRMSSVVEEEGRKVEQMEVMKGQLEEQMKGLEEKMREESEQYAEEKERLTAKATEMEKLIEEERKKANEEMERRVEECRGELERKMEEILVQKNELINQLEKMECESGDKEYTNEENERRLEGEKAMMETMMANVMREKKEMEEELERVKREKEETARKMVELGGEFEAMKNAIGEMEELRNSALEESRNAMELSGAVEEMKRVNEELKREMEGKEKAMVDAMANVMREKTEISDELEVVKREKEEAARKMVELVGEFEGVKNAIAEMEGLRTLAFDESRHATELNIEVEQLKRVNEELKKASEETKRGMDEKEKEMESLRSSLSALAASEGRMGEMEERVKELEREKRELQMTVRGMQMETDVAGKMESRMEDMMSGLMKKTEDHFKETSALKEEILDLKRKIMETEVEMKAKQKELESNEQTRRGMEGEMERMKEETRAKMESMEAASSALKKDLDERMEALTTANENGKAMEQKMISMEENARRRMEEMEEEKQKALKEMAEQMDGLKNQITTLTEGIGKMEEELERKKGEMELMERAVESEKEKSAAVSQSEGAFREMHSQMEEANQRVANAESTLTRMTAEKEEAERRAMEESAQKEELMRMMEEVKREKEEMRERMETIQKEREIEKSTTSHQLEEAVKSMQVQMEKEKEEKKVISLRLAAVENEKMEAEKSIEAERERNDILSATVKQLEDEIDQRTPVTTVSSGLDEGEKNKLEKELAEERNTVARLRNEVKRLEDACDEFDDVEWKLKEALVEKQARIDALEGKKKGGGPALLDALKPTTTEVKAMNETVMVEPSQSSPPREVAGREEREEKEDEEMKEYGTPSGSVMEEEDRKMADADETLGVTKIDGTRYEVDEEEYDRVNQTRPNASCRQS